MKKKIILIVFIILFVILSVFAAVKIKNYSTYKNILDIFNKAKEQVLIIKNVSVGAELIANGEKIEDTDNKIVIKELKQCDTNNREFAEEKGIDYRILNLNDNICYTIVPHDDKKIYIENADYEDVYTIELLKNSVIPEYSLKETPNYRISDEKINDKDCYKITINEENEDFYEYNYWIEKETGLLVKEVLKFYTNENNEKTNNTHEINYSYSIGTVTEYDVRGINLEDYADYKIVDKR